MFEQEHYRELIEQLKPVVSEPEFDTIFAQLTSDEDGPTRLQLKMELRRLVTPCTRTIDMRSETIRDCIPFSHNGRIHYLDSRAEHIFNQGLQRYRGVFTQDTFEQIKALTNSPGSASVSHLNAPIWAPLFTFASNVHRQEERMNFVMKLMLSESTEGVTEHTFTTTDISVRGLRLKISDRELQAWAERLTIGAELMVRFTGFAEKFTFDAKQKVPYLLVNRSRDDNGNLFLGLRRHADFDSESFDNFVVGFINGHKKRYKLNLDNTQTAIRNKGHEQFYFPRMNAVPVFFKVLEQRVFADLILQTDNNKSMLAQWQDAENEVALGGLFNNRRINELLKQPQAVKEITLYSFSVSSKGKVLFYSASASELQQHQLWQTFVAYGRTKPTWRVYKFSLTKVDKTKIWQPITIPNTTDQQRPPSARVMQRLKGLRYVGLLSDVTEFATPEIELPPLQRSHAQRIKQFLHPQKLAYKTDIVPLEFVNLRKESRFSYRTPVRFAWRNRMFTGVTVDFSISGLQIEVDEGVDVPMSGLIELDLTELDRHRKNVKLQRLPYEVVGRSEDGSSLNLRIVGERDAHTGATFFAQMISSNYERLHEQREKNLLQGMSLCLRNLYAASLQSLVFFLHKPPTQGIVVGQVGVGAPPQPTQQLLLGAESSEQIDISLLFDDASWPTEVAEPVQELTREDKPQRKLLYLLWQHEHRDQTKTMIHQWQYDHTDSSGIYEIARVLMLEMSRTGRPDTEFIQKEVSYLAHYAGHKASDMQDLLWRVTGVMDVTDITQTYLLAQTQSLATIEKNTQLLLTDESS